MAKNKNFRVKGLQTRIGFSAMTTHVKRTLSFEKQFEAKSIAFPSTSWGAAKLRAAEILRPEFAAQEQEKKTCGLQEPQFLLWTQALYAWILEFADLIVIVIDDRFTTVILASINTVQMYQGLVSKCLPR